MKYKLRKIQGEMDKSTISVVVSALVYWWLGSVCVCVCVCVCVSCSVIADSFEPHGL